MFSNITSEINKLTNKLAGSSVATAKNVAKAISQLGEYVGTDDDGGGVFWVKLTYDQSTSTASLDATFANIKEAYENGKDIKCYLVDGSTAYTFNLLSVGLSQNGEEVTSFSFDFIKVYPWAGNLNLTNRQVSVDNTDYCTYYNNTVKLVMAS